LRKYLFLLIAAPLPAQPVNYAQHIAPILFEYCTPCHRPGEAAPFSLLTYDDARKHARQIADITARRYMPPWPPEPGHGDFADVRRLSDAQLKLLARWADTGQAQGDPAAIPPTPHYSPGWQLGEPDLILHMRRPYRLAAAGGDVFRNFVLPVELKETKYVRAMELRPGEKRVVHHANLIVDRARLLRRSDGLDGQPGFAGMDVVTEASGEFDPESHFLFWKPGTPAQQEPADMAWRLDPGSDLIVNLHLQPTGKIETVDAVVGLYFTDQIPTRKPMLVQLEHDGAIDVAPGATQTVTDHLKFPIAVEVLAIYPHAHYIGKQVEAWADLPGGARRPLILIKNWDIQWQATYTYAKPISLPAGSTISMRVTYVNSTAKRVKAGNRSEDEMGHVWLQVLPKTQGDIDPRLLLQEAVMRRRIEKYPADFVAHFNLGAALQAQQRHADALPFLKQAVQVRPQNSTAHNNLAISLLAVDKTPEAIQEFRQSLILDPDYQSARYNLASTLAQNGDPRGALTELGIYLRAVPNDVQALELAGRVSIAVGRLPDSLPYFRKAAVLEPDNGAIQTNLGAALAMSGDVKGAIAAFEAALEIDPTNQPARDNLARARTSLEGKR
jgi:Flp pilus assembly protein TadD